MFKEHLMEIDKICDEHVQDYAIYLGLTKSQQLT